MATQLSEEQGNSYRAEQPADIENVCGSVGSAPSQSGGALEISKEEAERRCYRPLLLAAFRGDWEFAKRFFEGDPATRTAKLTSRSETALHIAALSARDQFVENLVELLSRNPKVLEMVDCDGKTALHNAVLCGRIRMVKALVGSNPKLTQLPDNEGRVPLGVAAVDASMHKEIAWFLAKSTTDDGPSHPFSSPSALTTMIGLTYAGHHDITLYLVERYPHLITMKDRDRYPTRSILDGLAKMRSHFPSGTRLSILEALIYKCIPVDLNYKPADKNADPALQCLARSLWIAVKTVVPSIKRVHEVKLRHVAAVQLAKQCCIAISAMSTTEIADFFQEGGVLFQATTSGNSEIMKLCIQFFPELIRIPHYGIRLSTHAVKCRRERTLGLFLNVRPTNELSLVPVPSREESSNMILAAAKYAVAKYYPSSDYITDAAGAAFQMQRELQWYKAVESFVTPHLRAGYYEGKTVWNMFLENHKELLEKGEKWVKDTSDKCMLVSTLIATVLFAAAFAVPGGNDNKTGVPLLLGQDSVLVFIISDAVGLFSSVTAILLFLAILTSRYEPQDFLDSLPKRIIMGLCFLFLSLAFMLVAFVATLKIVLDKRLEWVLIPITLLASLPVALFAVLQLPLLYQMVKSTYGPSIFRVEDIWK